MHKKTRITTNTTTIVKASARAELCCLFGCLVLEYAANGAIRSGRNVKEETGEKSLQCV